MNDWDRTQIRREALGLRWQDGRTGGRSLDPYGLRLDLGLAFRGSVPRRLALLPRQEELSLITATSSGLQWDARGLEAHSEVQTAISR